MAHYREASYRLLGGSLAYPEPERVLALTEAAGDLWEERGALARFPFFPKLRTAIRALLDQVEQESVDLPTTYVSLFTARRSQIPCPPYEASYRSPPGESTGWLIAEVEQAYSVAGMAISSEGNELPDHISIELEFMAVLCGREATAWEQESVRVADHALGAQKSFLDEHLSQWVPQLAALVKKADQTGIYNAVVAASEALIMHDSDYAPALREMLSGLPEPESSSEADSNRPADSSERAD